MLGLYRFATGALGPLIRLYLERRKALGKEDPLRFEERLGHPSRPRPPGALIWVHAASVGESLSVLPLVERVCVERPAVNVLVTTGTLTSARLMAERLPQRAFHQYVPVDRAAYVRSFLDHWKPDLALWVESEFWPNLLTATAARGIPLVLVNGRISDRSFLGWKKYPGLILTLLQSFTLALGQTEVDRDRLRDLGAKNPECLGNLKFAAPPLPVDPATLDELRLNVMGRPLWLAASTHPGEEALAGRVGRALGENVLTVMVPRHPQRGEAIAADLRAQGHVVARRSIGDPLTLTTTVYLADTLGELGLFYRLCPVVFMGKSLLTLGGQNPFEPVRLGRGVL
ncbi:MAG: 3-deoxy-D-manno-octulosonic acid transferase, partial [Alphaproteobacteria bacterium RIFOXYD12_FULL_60_8]